MTATALSRLALTVTIAAGMASGAMAQSSDLKRGDMLLAQTATSPDEYQDGYQDEYQDEQPGGMMDQGAMPERRMPQPRTPEQRMPQRMMPERGAPDRMMGRMHRRGMPRLKIMFAIIDTDEDGSISFEEVTAVTKRIFDAIDIKNDGKVTLEEIKAFMWN